MRVVAVEEHMLTTEVLVAAGIDPRGRVASRAGELADLGDGRLAMMDAAGIDVQVLSAISHAVQELDPDLSIELSRTLNDRMAEATETHPDRFRAFAALPMVSPAAAVAELRRATEELGFVGAMIHGQTRGVFLDDQSVFPILSAAQDLAVPIYLHPAPPPPAVQKAYFSGLEAGVSTVLATSGWGWHAECGMHIMRMVVAGVFERLPNLQVIAGHMGENLPFNLARADDMLTPLLAGHDATVAETVLRNVQITMSGYMTAPPLLCALEVMGADRIMFSVDHPYANSQQATDFLLVAPLSDDDRDKIAHGNAERLLRL